MKTYAIDYNDPEVQKLSTSISNHFKTTAYPNYESYFPVESSRNVQKWLQAVQDIYYKQNNGIDRITAFSQVLGNWDKLELLDFKSWLKFYEEGSHLKYKTAQNWYEGSSPGYFLPIKKEEVNDAKDVEETPNHDKKIIIEKQRNKIIGRLDSAEKLLRSDDGQLFAGKEFETLLEIIYQLKKKIQLVNKKSSSTKLYEDLIIREANVLNKKGFVKAAGILYKLSQDAVPAPTPPELPTNVSGAPTSGPSTTVGNTPQDNNNPNLMTENSEPSEGMKEFLDGLNGGNFSDELSVDDELEVNDADDLIVEAQAAPTKEPENLEVVDESTPAPQTKIQESDSKTVKESPSTTNFDNIIDAAFANLTVDDVVAKLEDVAKIFKNREIPRQLAIVDMMLDKLAMSAFFPQLAEATNKSLESNQYVLTRVEDILAKLRGSMVATNAVDLIHSTSEKTNPETAALQAKLQQDADNEKNKKQLRKDLEDKALQDKMTDKETPEVEIDEDLSAPVNVAPPAAPVAPAPPVK